MAKNMQPIAKRCRALGISPATMGYTGKCKNNSNRNPGSQRRAKKSEYALQLIEKQKVKFAYGVLEKQFRLMFARAVNMKGNTGENLLQLLELRLDNAVYRSGLANTRAQARQFVCHGLMTVNGKKVDIPSYTIKVGDVIGVRETRRDLPHFKGVKEGVTSVVPKWLETDAANLTCKVNALPLRDDIDLPVEENIIVEFYSR